MLRAHADKNNQVAGVIGSIFSKAWQPNCSSDWVWGRNSYIYIFLLCHGHSGFKLLLCIAFTMLWTHPVKNEVA